MVPRNVLGSPERTFWIQHSLANSTQLTPIVQLPGVEGDHHDAGVGPQERAVERGVLSRIGQALSSVNHNDPIHLSTNHEHLHLITTVITASLRAPATVHSPSDLVDTTWTLLLLHSQAEYLPCLTYPLPLTSCVFSLCSPLPPDRLSPWSVCSSCVFPSQLPVISVDEKTLSVTRLPIVRTISDVIHSPEVSIAHPV